MMRAIRYAALGAAVLIAGAALAQDAPRLITGDLRPLGPPVPPGALAVIEATDTDGRPIAETAFIVRDTGSPFRIGLGLPAATAAELRAAIFVDGIPRWAVSGITVPEDATALVPDIVDLPPFVPVGPRIALRCAGRDLGALYDEDRAVVTDGSRRILLDRVGDAPGTLYRSVDGSAALSRRGNRIDLGLDGADLSECALVPPRDVSVYSAGGNEPGWRATLSEGSMHLSLDFGATEAHGPVEATRITDDGDTFTGPDGAVLRRTPGLCRDTMSGMPHPDAVTLATGGRTHSGCGGDPRDLLTGTPWTVDRIDGRPLPAGSDTSLEFSADGTLGGSTGCNRYRTTFTITGEAASAGPIAATRRLCPEADMATEAAFLAALAAVGRFDIADDGRLLLYDPSRTDPAITATRSAP